MTVPPKFHFSFAINDLDRARAFYGEIVGCKEGRKLPGRADFNFFGHHLVAHLSPEDVLMAKVGKIGLRGDNPVYHFGVILPVEEFDALAVKFKQAGVEFIRDAQQVRGRSNPEQRSMVVSDGCGNAVEFKGLHDSERVFFQ